MSEFPGTSGHMLSDNHVKTDILPHNSYSAAEVQHLASYHLRETKPMSFSPLRPKEVQAKCPYPLYNLLSPYSHSKLHPLPADDMARLSIPTK